MVYLVRHGAHALVNTTLCGRTDPAPLSAEGVEQARRLARQFSDRGVGSVQSSPRQRARDTAAPIASAINVTLTVEPAIDELDVGAWTGRLFEALDGDPDWRAWNERRATTRPPDGESMAELQRRVVGHLASLRESDAEAVVVVTHAEPIRSALLHCYGLSLDRFAEIDVAPGSISVLSAQNDGFRVDVANLRALS